MGVSIICNKHRGVYAALCESVYQARRAKQVNNTNVLCMGGFIIGPEMGRAMAAFNFRQADRLLDFFALNKEDVSLEYADEGVFRGPKGV